MIITPFEELEQQARERYRERFARVPKPKVINASASVSLDAPRCFLWGGLTYWVPPLGFEDGLRLFIAGRALRDIDGAPPAQTAEVTRMAARLILGVLRPTLKARIVHALRGNPFRTSDASELGSLCDWLVHVPDEAGFVPSSKPVTLDLVDSRYAFEGFYKRPPRSWADYVYGCNHLSRHAAREDLRLATAVRLAHWADKNGWKDFEADTRASAGWT